jgi:hypothetical protein
VSAAVSAATVEATSCCPAKSTADVAVEAARWAACKTASTEACARVGTATVTEAWTTVTEAWASVVAATVTEACMAIVAWPKIAGPAIVSVKPRSRADEQTTGEPARSVVAVRRTSVRRISVVAVLAYRRSGIVSRAKSYTHANPDLGLRIGQWNHQNRQQGHMLEITHLFYPLASDSLLHLKHLFA